MKHTISMQAIIGTVRSRVDRSISFTAQSPELTTEERALFMELTGSNVLLTIAPEGETAPDYKVHKELQSKTPSQRLRSVLFVVWKAKGEPDEFETFYTNSVEAYIDALKKVLDGYER